jgi:hypothetical protein
MADVKKDKPEGWDFDAVETIVLILVLTALVGTIVPAILSYFSSGEISFYGYKLSGIVEFFRSNVLFFKILGFTIAIVAAVYAFVFTKKGDAILREERAKVYPENMPVVSTVEASKNPMLEKWEKIVKLSESQNSSDWRLAVIEADIILDGLLQKLQLPGDTMGDKLKAVEKSDFTTIESAWEAHKFRNNIAHEGSDFLINEREIHRVISLYEAVFKEFELV